MPKLTIDNMPVEVVAGATILDAAAKLGIAIPTLCHLEGRLPCTSCFVCVVKVAGRENLLPACATAAVDNMRVESQTDEVLQARRTALELLLSDHVGDCIGPCHDVCPAKMNIPRMTRQIAAGDLAGAVATVKADIALPAVLGRICPAPCEAGCRRKPHDGPLSIMLLKRFVADADLASPSPYLPQCRPASGRKVAVVGAGPTGLAAAWHLVQLGHACTVFDDHDVPGGALQYAVPEDRLPRKVLADEIDVIARLGARFRTNVRVGETISLEDLRRDFDAVLLAIGQPPKDLPALLGVKAGEQGIAIDRKTFLTSLPGLFAAGNAVRRGKLAVRSVADGKGAATSIDQHLAGKALAGPARAWTCHIRPLLEGEFERFLAAGSGTARLAPTDPAAGFTQAEARSEALRCLHCDCRKADNCRLRRHADTCQADPARYKGPRRLFEQIDQHARVIYEPGKCIDCGLCVQIAAEAREELGLAFIGRGFNVRVGVPFGRGLTEALTRAAADCVAACPTAALSFKDPSDQP